MLGFGASAVMALVLFAAGLVLTTTPEGLAGNWKAWQAAYPVIQAIPLETLSSVAFLLAGLFAIMSIFGLHNWRKAAVSKGNDSPHSSPKTHGYQSPIVDTGDHSPVNIAGSFNTTSVAPAAGPTLPWHQQGGAPQLTCDNPEIDERGKLPITFRLTGTPPPVGLSGKWEGIVDVMEWITQTLGDQGEKIMDYPSDPTKFTMRGTIPNVSSDRAVFRLRFYWGDGHREIQQEFRVPPAGERRRQLTRSGATVPVLIAGD